MARVKRYLDSRASDSHERWLVSYADFITLLFAFFVVMYALSTINEGKYRVMGSAIGLAFRPVESGKGPGGSNVVQGRLVSAGEVRGLNAWRQREQRTAQARKSMLAALAPLAESGDAQVLPGPRGVMVEIGAGVLFNAGDAALQPAARAPLAAVAQALKGLDQQIEVEGHTDDAPMQSAKFPSNWELSAARASSVVRFLQERGVAPDRLSAAGFAEYRPIAPNSGNEGRSRNRRVAIVIVDPEPLVGSAGIGEGAPARSQTPMEFPVQPQPR